MEIEDDIVRLVVFEDWAKSLSETHSLLTDDQATEAFSTVYEGLMDGIIEKNSRIEDRAMRAADLALAAVRSGILAEEDRKYVLFDRALTIVADSASRKAFDPLEPAPLTGNAVSPQEISSNVHYVDTLRYIHSKILEAGLPPRDQADQLAELRQEASDAKDPMALARVALSYSQGNFHDEALSTLQEAQNAAAGDVHALGEILAVLAHPEFEKPGMDHWADEVMEQGRAAAKDTEEVMILIGYAARAGFINDAVRMANEARDAVRGDFDGLLEVFKSMPDSVSDEMEDADFESLCSAIIETATGDVEKISIFAVQMIRDEMEESARELCMQEFAASDAEHIFPAFLYEKYVSGEFTAEESFKLGDFAEKALMKYPDRAAIYVEELFKAGPDLEAYADAVGVNLIEAYQNEADTDALLAFVKVWSAPGKHHKKINKGAEIIATLLIRDVQDDFDKLIELRSKLDDARSTISSSVYVSARPLAQGDFDKLLILADDMAKAELPSYSHDVFLEAEQEIGDDEARLQKVKDAMIKAGFADGADQMVMEFYRRRAEEAKNKEYADEREVRRMGLPTAEDGEADPLAAAEVPAPEEGKKPEPKKKKKGFLASFFSGFFGGGKE